MFKFADKQDRHLLTSFPLVPDSPMSGPPSANLLQSSEVLDGPDLDAKRLDIIMDFWIAQESLLNDLSALIQDFQEPLLFERWMSKADHDILFHSVEEIYELHKMLHKYLDSLAVQSSRHKGNSLKMLKYSLLDFVSLFQQKMTCNQS